MKVPSNINSCSPGLFHSCKRAGAQLSREQSSTSLGNTWKYVYIRTSFMFPFFFFFFSGCPAPRVVVLRQCGRGTKRCSWQSFPMRSIPERTCFSCSAPRAWLVDTKTTACARWACQRSNTQPQEVSIVYFISSSRYFALNNGGAVYDMIPVSCLCCTE